MEGMRNVCKMLLGKPEVVTYGDVDVDRMIILKFDPFSISV
jgi:hypothetical protein